MRAKGEVGVQSDVQDFRGFVQRGHLVTDSHLLGSQDWWVSEVNRFTLDFFPGSNGQLFPVCPPHQGGEKLVSPRLILHDAASRGRQREVVGIGRHVRVRDGAIVHKVVKESWLDSRPLCNSRRHWRESERCCW